jgi:hypothetical protein
MTPATTRTRSSPAESPTPSATRTRWPWAATDSWDGDLDTALSGYGRQRDQCAIPLSDANLRVGRLDMPTGPLGAAWFQMTGLEQALDDPAAVSDQPPARRTLSSTTQINH